MDRDVTVSGIHPEIAIQKCTTVPCRQLYRFVDRDGDRIPFRTKFQRMNSFAEIDRPDARRVERSGISIVIPMQCDNASAKL